MAALSSPLVSLVIPCYNEVTVLRGSIATTLQLFDRHPEYDWRVVIADNGSSSRYVTGGRPRDPKELDLRTIGVVIEKNGEIMALGASAAVLNHPANAIVMLLKHLAGRGESLPAGSYVMTGGITEAIPVAAGDSIVARFQEMGSVSFRFV